MILDYLTQNYMTLMILGVMVVIMLINRKRDHIPGTNHFSIVIVLLFTLTIIDAIESRTPRPNVRMVCATISYIIRPLIIMLQVFVASPKKQYRVFFAIPGILNALVYSTALFNSHLAFFIDEGNHWHAGPLSYSIYFTQMFYVFLLALFSIIYFRRYHNIKRSAFVLLIVVLALISAIMEYTDTLHGTADPVTALCILVYYFYMAANYRNEMQELIAENELRITKQRLSLLQNQIQPHFIFNSLSIIRSLAKHDSAKAVDCIDSFSDYLKAHVYAIRDDEMVPFAEELSNIKAYLNLVQADSRRNVTVEYDLREMDFMIPALSLEPIVENAIKYGVGPEGGLVRIESYAENDMILVRVIDTGSSKGGASMTDQEVHRLGVGLDNTKKRLALQCEGTVTMDKTDHGTTVTISIPNS